ncbi:hypothetical protein BP6252_02261 [Coleophoma cylindrospora]|uniref:Uncharacterized protein n=1 Tax=Coleophoma cylindrospora TaxID=1849047 RepID=A0A3D8SEP7_9HELO|nr:hypothetical protein BP6252_02261 [Coleophoma cylindrospora]
MPPPAEDHAGATIQPRREREPGPEPEPEPGRSSPTHGGWMPLDPIVLPSTQLTELNIPQHQRSPYTTSASPSSPCP